MRTLALVAFQGLLLTGISAAALVDFTTAGVLACGSASNCTAGGGSITFQNIAGSGQPTLTISYAANSETDLNANPAASTSFGYIGLSCTLCSGVTTSFNLTGATLAISINQGPDPFNQSGGAFNGTFSGTMSVTGGNLGGSGMITFGSAPIQTVFNNGSLGVTYILQEPVPPPVVGYILSSNNTTSIQGVVLADQSDTGVPEPATLTMLGLGLVAFSLFRRRQA